MREEDDAEGGGRMKGGISQGRGRMMEEGGGRGRDDDEEGAQPRMKVTDSMVIDCK